MKNRRQQKALDKERQGVQAELDGIRSELENAYLRFDGLSDPELMDACIYEISALRAHYNSTMKRMKCLYS